MHCTASLFLFQCTCIRHASLLCSERSYLGGYNYLLYHKNFSGYHSGCLSCFVEKHETCMQFLYGFFHQRRLLLLLTADELKRHSPSHIKTLRVYLVHCLTCHILSNFCLSLVLKFERLTLNKVWRS